MIKEKVLEENKMKEKKSGALGKIVISVAVTLAVSIPVTIGITTNNIVKNENNHNENSANVYVNNAGEAINSEEYEKLKSEYEDLKAKYNSLEQKYKSNERDATNNEETNTSTLGKEDIDYLYLMDVCPPYDITSGKTLYEGNKSFKMCGETYNYGFTYASPGPIEDYAILFNLDGGYSKLEFDWGHIDDTGMYEASVNIVLDGEIVKSLEKQPDDLVSHESIELNNAKQLKLCMVSGVPNSFAHYGFANIKLYK